MWCGNVDHSEGSGKVGASVHGTVRTMVEVYCCQVYALLSNTVYCRLLVY